MVIGQLPVYRGGRSAYRAPTGTLWAKVRKPLFSELASPLLASRSQARSLLLSADCSAPTSESTDSEWSFRHLLTQFPTAPRNQPAGPRHLRDSPVLLDYLKDHLLLELTTESLCRHNQIIPHLSKQYSFHHCPRNTRHLTTP